MKRYFRTEAHNKAGVVVKNTFLEVHPSDVWSLDIIFDVKFQCWLSRACQVGDHIPSLHDWCGNLVQSFFFHLMKLTAKAKAIVRACWELRACKPGLRNNFFSLIEGRVAFILWTLRHISILVRYWSLHRYSKRIFRSFLHHFHMICRFTGWLVPWQSAVERVFSGENLHQCGSGWGGVQTFGVVDFKGCWSGCWVRQTIDHWLLQNYCTQRCFVY